MKNRVLNDLLINARQENIHLILTKDEWEAVLNCVDIADNMIYGWPSEYAELKKECISAFKSSFSHEFLEKVSNKLSFSR